MAFLAHCRALCRAPDVRLATLWVLVALCIAASTAQAAPTKTIKIATIAPDGTIWMDSMRAGAEEIQQRTQGRVKFKFYPGAVMGNDKTVLRKIRVKQLHGGVVIASSLAGIYPDIQLYSQPLLFHSRQEARHVRAQLDKELIEGLAQRDFVAFGFIEGGFAYFMSQAPIRSIAELRQRRVWLPEEAGYVQTWFKTADVPPVPLPMTDVLMGLQTRLIDTVAISPVGALAFQWHSKVDYILDLPLVYLYVALVLRKDILSQLDAQDQTVVREVMTRVQHELDAFNARDNQRAFDVLRNQGLEVVSPTTEGLQAFAETAREARQQLRASKVFSAEGLQRLDDELTAYRSKDQ